MSSTNVEDTLERAEQPNALQVQDSAPSTNSSSSTAQIAPQPGSSPPSPTASTPQPDSPAPYNLNARVQAAKEKAREIVARRAGQASDPGAMDVRSEDVAASARVQAMGEMVRRFIEQHRQQQQQ